MFIFFHNILVLHIMCE